MAAQATIAVAANFTAAAKEIGQQFEASSDHTLIFSFGSTGQLYNQIAQDAPFDVFLAADQARPMKAISRGFAVKGSRFTYATGKIALYSADKNRVQGAGTLRGGNFHRIAIANPVTAPYGAAAIEVMRNLNVYNTLEDKIVRGSNIAQTYAFIVTGNAELGFVALSEIATHDKGSRWIVPAQLYQPIAQDAVLLEHGADNPAAIAFLRYLKTPDAQAIEKRYGYGTER